jgi:hypothetical protein
MEAAKVIFLMDYREKLNVRLSISRYKPLPRRVAIDVDEKRTVDLDLIGVRIRELMRITGQKGLLPGPAAIQIKGIPRHI